ncbi:hypothetical protein ACFQZJ_16080 [Maribacter chungangensis]|uniref:Uncharacterized protein n=1 Tax=Maribacter chungangensis TaxID=1069117 RepID=A0ABW3B6Q1_9FLAO
MGDIIKSIVLGVLTVTVWFAASIVMKDLKDNSFKKENKTKEQITFVETLTIDYEGDTKKM